MDIEQQVLPLVLPCGTSCHNDQSNAQIIPAVYYLLRFSNKGAALKELKLWEEGVHRCYVICLGQTQHPSSHRLGSSAETSSQSCGCSLLPSPHSPSASIEVLRCGFYSWLTLTCKSICRSQIPSLQGRALHPKSRFHGL